MITSIPPALTAEKTPHKVLLDFESCPLVPFRQHIHEHHPINEHPIPNKNPHSDAIQYTLQVFSCVKLKRE